jgi:hypothetical protein
MNVTCLTTRPLARSPRGKQQVAASRKVDEGLNDNHNNHHNNKTTIPKQQNHH